MRSARTDGEDAPSASQTPPGEESIVFDRTEGRASMRTAFWSWMIIIVVGLATMIVLPLLGR